MALAVMLPEVSAMFDDNGVAWAVYLAAGEVVKALLCLVMAVYIPAFRTIGAAASIWFLTQAADEMTNGNLWTDDVWEYLLLLIVSAFLLWLHAVTKR